MAVSNWCVDKYKSDFESEEHWLLRKKFMETHKDKFPENKLVCLARVFFNVEFLGCKYPDKTMQLVAELSRGVADEYRENQKGKLKRTFVKASDAAGAKIKGTPSKADFPSKMLKTPPEQHARSNIKCFFPQNNDVPTIIDAGDFPGFIIFVNSRLFNQVETCPVSILTQSAAKSRKWKEVAFHFPIEKITEAGDRICEISINNKFLSSGEGKTNKEAKIAACAEGLRILRKTCYTVQAKCAFYSEGPSISKGVQSREDKPLPPDNIGTKMMQKMGWTGSGLGKNQQGIQEPVKAASQIIRREGLGSMNKNQMQAKFRKIFKDFIASDSDYDLVFTSDFSHNERKTLHMLAQNFYSLKTRSYGKDENRHLVVFKLFDLRTIVKSLLEQGGETEKYLLIPPSGADET